MHLMIILYIKKARVQVYPQTDNTLPYYLFVQSFYYL